MAKEITILELLRQQGLEGQIQNSQLTRAIVAQLKEKGYVKKRRKGGAVWVKEDGKAALDYPQMARRITHGL